MKKLKSILLVDDDPVANYLHINLLESLHIAEKVDIVTNGEEALKYINTVRDPEVILLDLHMPVMDGILFLQNFRNFSSDSKAEIYILTSSEHKQDITECSSWGVYGYIIKPLTESKLKEFFSIDTLSAQEEEDTLV